MDLLSQQLHVEPQNPSGLHRGCSGGETLRRQASKDSRRQSRNIKGFRRDDPQPDGSAATGANYDKAGPHRPLVCAVLIGAACHRADRLNSKISEGLVSEVVGCFGSCSRDQEWFEKSVSVQEYLPLSAL